MAYERKDHFYRKAKAEGKASRAAYKLQQLQDRFRLIGAGDRVVDLGCAPGGWVQEAVRFVGPNGLVVGVDLLPLTIHLPKNFAFIQGDIRDEHILQEVRECTGGAADVVLSDMAPNTSGVPFADAYRSYELALRAFETCTLLLKRGGHFAVKIFPGDELAGFRALLQQHFEKISTVVPPATRKTSSELYVIGQRYKKPA